MHSSVCTLSRALASSWPRLNRDGSACGTFTLSRRYQPVSSPLRWTPETRGLRHTANRSVWWLDSWRNPLDQTTTNIPRNMRNFDVGDGHGDLRTHIITADSQNRDWMLFNPRGRRLAHFVGGRVLYLHQLYSEQWCCRW